MTETRTHDKDDEDQATIGIWQIIDGIKQKAREHLRTHATSSQAVIMHPQLEKLEREKSHDFKLIMQRLNGFRLEDGRHRIVWNTKHHHFCIESIALS